MTKVKNILREATVLLCKNLQPTDVVRYLKTKGAIKQDDAEKIKRQETTSEMVEELLDILKRKPVSAYETFMEVLERERHDLFSQVKAIETSHQYRGAGKFSWIRYYAL